jgi:hypothetical protein
MGGWTSGRNNRGAGRCESWHRVELTYLRKHEFLSPGRRSTLTWHRGGERTGSIGFCAFENHAELRYSCNGESVVQRINYRYTPTNFGSRGHVAPVPELSPSLRRPLWRWPFLLPAMLAAHLFKSI